MIEPKLKLKYRVRPYSKGGASSSSNSGKQAKSMQGTGHRRRSYGPFDTFTLAETKKRTK